MIPSSDNAPAQFESFLVAFWNDVDGRAIRRLADYGGWFPKGSPMNTPPILADDPLLGSVPECGGYKVLGPRVLDSRHRAVPRCRWVVGTGHDSR